MNTATPVHVLAFTLHYAEPPSFSAAEIVLLAVLILLSLAGFFWRFQHVLRNIFTARKDADFRIAPIGKRVWDFFWEVLCQAKVIRERPAARPRARLRVLGILRLRPGHAESLRGRLRPRLSRRHPASSAASTSGFAGRLCAAGRGLDRRSLRPPLFRAAHLAGRKVSYESGVIALLIFVLMVTYLAAFFVPRASVAARGCGGRTRSAFWSFLPLIPHTKHLHLVLSPFTIFLSRGGFSRHSAAGRR